MFFCLLDYFAKLRIKSLEVVLILFELFVNKLGPESGFLIIAIRKAHYHFLILLFDNREEQRELRVFKHLLLARHHHHKVSLLEKVLRVDRFHSR